VLFNFYEWFFVEAANPSDKERLLAVIKGDIESKNPARYEMQLRQLGGIYLNELGAQRRASLNNVSDVNFFELKNPNPLKFQDIFASFYNERLTSPQAFVSFSRPYFYSSGARMSPYLPMSVVPQFETRYKIDRPTAIKKLFSILIDINQKFQQDLEKVETEKISLTQQQPFRPVTVQNPQQTPATDAGKINISQITRGLT
jgi:hypothetical protein